MRLDAVKVHGLGPFRDFEVDLEQLGDALLVAITGANGAGKSTLLELAMPGALYRECPTRGSIQELATARDSYVEARLVNGSAWTIRHSVDAISRKGETLVLDADGKNVLSSTSVKAFDAWAARHLPAPEVLYSSVFCAQATTGFLGAKPGERKGILLRTLGIERYEVLAEKAREHGRGVKAELDALRARIDDERRRGGDVEAIERELVTLREAVAGAERALEDARGALTLARSGAPGLEAARREAQATRAKRGELASRVTAKRLELDQALLRLRNNRKVLDGADEIRAAKARSDVLTTEIARLGEELKAAEAARLAAAKEADQHDAAGREALERSKKALERSKAAKERLVERADVEAAGARVNELAAAFDAALVAQQTAEADLERVRGERLDGADDRIKGLRRALTDAHDADELETAVYAAAQGLSADDASVRAAAEMPERLRTAQEAAREAKTAADKALRELQATRSKASLKPAIDAAERELAQASEDHRAAWAEAESHEARTQQALASQKTHEAARVAAQEKRAHHQQELAQIAELAKKAGPLANAEGRLAELEPQVKALHGEIAELEATLQATPEPPETPAPPDLANLEARERAADQASKGAAAALTLAEGRLERAKESALLLEQLDGQRRGLDQELAEWTRLGADLGRDGLQALEIDAAGPELTELVNDLLRTCFGPRWTVSIETTKPSADGKRQLEGCEVRVLDTVAGREAEASTYSGGERVLLGEALSLALTMVACRRSGLRGVTLVRDESGAALSPANGRAYVAMLRRAAELVGASRVLFVTHVPELAELADARINVGAQA
jgi:exonuclease SbcC